MDLTALQWTGAAAAALLVGLSKTGFGAGAGLLAVPLMALTIGPVRMLPVMLLVLISGDVFSIGHYLNRHDGRNLAVLVPGLVAGVLLGWAFLDWFVSLPGAELILKRVIGGIAVTFVLLQFHRMRRIGSSANSIGYRPRPWHGVALGACGGLCSTLAHAGGPPVVLYLLPQNLDRQTFVGTVIKFFFVGNLLKLVPYWREGLLTRDALWTAVLVLPAVVVGTLAGVALNRRFSDRAFRSVVYALALCIGLYLLSGWSPGQAGDEASARRQFQRGLEHYAAERFRLAAEAFAAAAAEPALQGPSRLNAALALYHDGRYAAAAELFAGLGDGRGRVTLRAALNGGNCAYRQARYAKAVVAYQGVLVGQWDRVEDSLLGQVRRRARHNLGVARARMGPQPTAEQSGEPAGPAVPQSEATGAAAARVPVEGAPTDASSGAASGGRFGTRSVSQILAGAVSRDAGVVVRAEGVSGSAAGRW